MLLWRITRWSCWSAWSAISRAALLCALLGLGLAGCQSTGAPPTASLEITRVPPGNPGGPVHMAFIEGRAPHSKPGDQVVLYARAGIWWIQPFANQGLTQINPDGTWKNSTHLGDEYAALLVGPDFVPASKLKDLPQAGRGVIAVARATGKAAVPVVSKTIHFSGYAWVVRAADSDRGGQPNAYDPANVWTDSRGHLHLRMEEHNGVWSCAEVNLTRSLGYGSYVWVVQDSADLPPSAVLGLYTFDEFRTDDVRSELDVELSRWGNPDAKNAQFVVQPFYIPQNIFRFTAPKGVLTHTIRWEPGRASFRTVRGADPGLAAAVVSDRVFTSGIPTPGNEKAHIVLYDYHHAPRSVQQPAEVVIEKFEYLP